MAKHLALEHVAVTIGGSTIRLKPGDILDDALHPVTSLQTAGVALIAYNEVTMGELVRKFVGRVRREGEPEGSLLAVLAANGLLP